MRGSNQVQQIVNRRYKRELIPIKPKRKVLSFYMASKAVFSYSFYG